MRIHTLTFTAVGPYRERQHVDFNQLKASGLYLINGPTGAGKSTIIDAIVFALYGRPSGDDSDESRLRSDFAESTERTEVELVFETADGVFRVIRTPRYQRAQKRSGAGLTPEPATCKLYRVHSDGTEVEVARNIASANAELQDTLGLTADQFLQTVVLPQGQFATFLRARTVEREGILKRIFGTRLYEEVARLLKEDAQAARANRDAATAAIREAVIAIDAQVPFEPEERQRLLELVRDGLDDSLLSALHAVEMPLQSAAAALAECAGARLADANAADALRTLARDEAAASSAASAAEIALTTAVDGVANARVPVHGLRELAESLGLAVDDADDEREWRTRASAAATAAGALHAAVTAEEAVAAWPGQREELERALVALRAKAETGQGRLGELPARIAEQERVLAARPTADELTAHAQQAQVLKADEALYESADLELSKIQQLREQLESAITDANAADAAYVQASRALLDGLAAALALELREGVPCPVCGSREHPQPAARGDSHVSKEQVEQRERAARAAREVALKAEQALANSTSRVAELEQQAVRSRTALPPALDASAAEERALRARSEAAAQAIRALEELRSEQESLTVADAGLATAMALAEANLSTRTAAYEANLTVARDCRGAYASVAARVQAIVSLQQHLNALADALSAKAVAAQAAQLAAAALAAFAARDGFADVTAAESAFAAAARAKSTADTASHDAARRLSALQDGIAKVRAGCEQRAALVAGNASLLHLAELFNPGRGSDSGLHIYVLQALFANVVEAANRRFETLLSGRFRLVATRDEGGDARSLLGLGLAVQDGLTGKSRPATSLSGGETFCASLALALGLADIVRMGSGGIEIGSLFIDEGFGSLDPKPLEDVMAMLRQLGSNGRVVGLISHVPEMKTAIAERISVLQAGERRPAQLHVSWME